MNDKYGRKINYLRISVTDRCNLRCTYCMPSEGIPLMDHTDILSYEEITRLARLAHDLGFTKFRITGGEPLVRKGVTNLVANISDLGEDVDLSLTTNGTLLMKYARDLKASGLRRINISLDTLDREKFRRISRFDLFGDVMDGIHSAIEAGFDPIKINVVMMKGINDDEILDFVELTRDQPLWVRFIELMPFSRDMACRVPMRRKKNFMSADEIRRHIEVCYRLEELNRADSSAPATDYLVRGHEGRIGFIAPISKKFCDSCNRIRLTADGRLLPCLLSDIEIDIKTPMRKGMSDEELKPILQSAMLNKPEGHTLHENNLKNIRRAMSRVGG